MCVCVYRNQLVYMCSCHSLSFSCAKVSWPIVFVHVVASLSAPLVSLAVIGAPLSPYLKVVCAQL